MNLKEAKMNLKRINDTKIKAKKSDAVKQLELDFHSDKLKRFSAPYLTVTLFDDSTANGLNACIQAYLKLQNIPCYRINSQGQWDKNLGRYRHSGASKGVSDIIAIHNGIHISIEVKIGRDKLSEVQKKVKEDITNAKGHYIIAKTFEAFIDALNSIISNSTSKTTI